MFQTRQFARLARKLRLPRDRLRECVERLERSEIDATLGRFLVKQRIASGSKGRAGGHRAILCFVEGRRTVFLFVFTRADRATLTQSEENAFREAAKQFALVSDDEEAGLIADGKWIEIEYGDKDLS